ncbi:poly (ADP-ribose) glycohydrolase (PARG) domain-containing protein [Phthorimaea operculella]|nr:poly (ADP-ribose) glycohydrolase (PARG) domain-containing protein [Phthorimaea operculella]
MSCAVPRGAATFTRRSVPPRGRPDWPHSRAGVAAIPVHLDSRGNIEDADGLIQLDFANKYLGGGVLGHGCVQEEIRFVICPELMVSMLFTEVMRPNEAFLMIGCQRYNKYRGYGRSFRWDGDYSDHTPRDSSGRRRVCVLAIDALPYSNDSKQYCEEMITRELNKAWVGFSFLTAGGDSSLQYPGLATGNWGCGAFGGSPGLKSLIQLMAAAQTRRPMAYFTFDDAALRDQIINTYNLLARYNVTVGQLYQYIMKFCSSDVPRSQLHEYLHQMILDEDKKGRSAGGDSANRMDISSPPAETSKEKKREDSPDLFSTGDETPSTSTSPPPAIKPTETKPKTDIPPQTKRLFDELQKFDEESGTLNLITPVKKDTKSKYFDSQKFSEDLFQSSDDDTQIDDVSMEDGSEKRPVTKMAGSENKMSDSDTKSSDNKMVQDEHKMTTSEDKIAARECKMAANETNMAASTSRLFEEMEKFDEEHGRLNLTVPSTSYLHETTNDSMVIENEKVEVTSEKKKITKKITDYFSKKPT